MARKNSKKYAVVYQAGIANIFQVDCFNACAYGRNAKRILQHSFVAIEWFARGLMQAGAKVGMFSCNKAGDISEMKWTIGLEDCPFRSNIKLFSNVRN
jgi:hypothetical protein